MTGVGAVGHQCSVLLKGGQTSWRPYRDLRATGPLRQHIAANNASNLTTPWEGPRPEARRDDYSGSREQADDYL
ncbi:hypothetical protein AoKodu_09100 [Actinomyces oris K20]|nr:hypothetical protein AoKodu_09100 [Actinomyces oris K20]